MPLSWRIVRHEPGGEFGKTVEEKGHQFAEEDRQTQAQKDVRGVKWGSGETYDGSQSGQSTGGGQDGQNTISTEVRLLKGYSRFFTDV